MQLNKEQERAIKLAIEAPNCIITGGAGTGKTTIIKAIMQALPTGYAYLAAPTGKAAARMKEVTGFYAETIHRLIGLVEDGMSFKSTDLGGKAVIIDEASMIDSWLMAKLIEANPQKIVLVGDDAQLPPVGAGSPFHDLITIMPEVTAVLKKSYRSRASIHWAGERIRLGIVPFDGEMHGEKYQFTQLSAEEAQETVVALYANNYLDPTQDIVLASIYGDGQVGGIDALNAAIMQTVNPHEEGQKWRVGDRVLNCKNFSAHDWWNGDMGTIVDVSSNGVNVEVQPDRPRNGGAIYITEKEMLKELKHGWALSVHKSQGSQWRRVVFLALRKHKFMLSRPLIYTAVTRAQKECLVYGDMYTFNTSLQKREVKQTYLKILAEKELIGV